MRQQYFTRRLTVVVAFAALAASACAPDDAATSVRLSVEYDPDWALSSMQIELDGARRESPVTDEILVLVPDDLADGPFDLRVFGLRDGEPFAVGETRVTPARGAEVRATLALEAIPCGAWCTPGSTACRDGGVVTCREASDGCLEWGEPESCEEELPSCSLGVCAEACVDECAEGDAQCAGPGGIQRCGDGDDDPCMDWLPPEPCVDDGVCSGGACRSECVSECEAGAVMCRGAGRVRCDDRNGDGCTEWGPMEPCGPDEGCEAGRCVENGSCSDQCEADRCTDAGFVRCGDFDFDPCLEPGPAVSCEPADACEVGSCDPEVGCKTAPRTCDAPPEPECVDADTLRVYEASGTCADGDCAYDFEDRPCESCPACDACAGVVCDSPPGPCYEAEGTCEGGGCSYEPLDSGSCDDGDACTTDDRCIDGACSGDTLDCAGEAGICEVGECDAEAGGCVTRPAADGTPCDNGDETSRRDTCQAGECVTPPLDVVLLFDMTGSYAATIQANRAALMADVVEPLLALANTEVGVSVFADFDVDPYGGPGDVPFRTIVHPTGSVSTLSTAIGALPTFNGNDGPESTIEALHVLSGGTPHPEAEPASCPAARDGASGCWRPEATKVVVVFTDANPHNGPGASGGTIFPYSDITPAPAEWPDVSAAMRRGDIALYAVVSESLVRTFDTMVEDLEQNVRQVFRIPSDVDFGTGLFTPELVQGIGSERAGSCTDGAENTIARCTDGCSNDGDRFVDCDDFDCCDVAACGPETACGSR